MWLRKGLAESGFAGWHGGGLQTPATESAMMATASTTLSAEDAARFRVYERQRHDAMAATYHDFFTPVTALAIKPLLETVHLRAGASILDVATGPGALAAEANRLGAPTIGVDLSPGMIELARKSYPGIDFRVAEVEHLPFADGSFDAVVCNFALGHFPYPEASVAECVRTLRTGGRIGLSWWDDPSKQRIQGLFREAIAEIGATPPPDVPTGHSILRFADTGEFRRLLEGAISAGRMASTTGCRSSPPSWCSARSR
jgi:SAM-dependent methyltransferase